MFHAEIIAVSQLNPNFHKFAEQLTGVNPAQVVQTGKRPRSQIAYILAYFKAFQNPDSDFADLRALLGMMHVAMLCAGPELEMCEVLGWPHGLRCLQAPTTRRNILPVIMSGTVEQWAVTLKNAVTATMPIPEWAVICHQQFARIDFEDYIGHMRSKGQNLFLDN